MDIKELAKVDALIDADLVLSFKLDITNRMTYLKLFMKSFLVNSEYHSKLYDFNADEFYQRYKLDGYNCIKSMISANVLDRSKQDKEYYNEYLLLLLALESLKRNKCKDALELYKNASLCGTNLTPIERRERKDKIFFTNVAREVWSYDTSHILMPAHVIKISKQITGINRSESTLKRWLNDEIIPPIEILKITSENKMPRGDAVNKQRTLLIDLIYDKLKGYCNEA